MEREQMLNELTKDIVDDAFAHHLYEDYANCRGANERRQQLAMRLAMEVVELFNVADKPKLFEKELADCVIMAMSIGGYEGINMGAAIEEKRKFNITRADRHAGEHGDCPFEPDQTGHH